jgi:protein gp37
MAIRLNGICAARKDIDNWEEYSSILKFDNNAKPVAWNGEVSLRHRLLDKPLHWKKPRRIFVCSMSDLFHPKVPFDFINKVFDVIRRTPDHTYQILTKRPKRMADFIYQAYGVNHKLDNAWLGVSISTEAEMWKAKILTDIPAAVRFISFEPLLEDIKNIPTEVMDRLGWGVIGCESGPKRREFDNNWALGLVADFHHFNKPVFVKQISVNGKVVKMPKGFPQEYPKGD